MPSVMSEVAHLPTERADSDLEKPQRPENQSASSDEEAMPQETVEPTSPIVSIITRRYTNTSTYAEPPPDGGLAAWMVVLSAHLAIMNSWGVVNSFGVFQPYYMTLLDRSPDDISWIGSLEVFFLFFLGSFTGRLTDAGYFRQQYVAGSFLLCLGIFMSSLCTRYWHFILAQGVCIGFGNGLLFTPCMAIASTYFTDKRSLAFGIISAGSVTGGLVFPSMVRQLLPSAGLSWTLRAIGFIQLGTLIFAGFFLKSRLPPRRSGPLIDLWAFEKLEFTFYVIGAFMAFWSTFFAFQYIATFSRDILGLSYPSSLNLILILGGAGGPGRVVPSYIGDKIGAVNVYLFCTLISGIIMFCWLAVSSVSSMYVWTVFYGFMVGGVQSVFPTGLLSLADDPTEQGTRIGMACTIVSFATLTGAPISGAIINLQRGEYLGAQVFAGTCLMVGAVFLFLSRTVRLRKMGYGAFAAVKL